MKTLEALALKVIKVIVWFILIAVASGMGVVCGLISYQMLSKDGTVQEITDEVLDVVVDDNTANVIQLSSARPKQMLIENTPQMNQYEIPLSFFTGMSLMHVGLPIIFSGELSLVFNSDDMFLRSSYKDDEGEATSDLYDLLDSSSSFFVCFYDVISDSYLDVDLSCCTSVVGSAIINMSEGDYINEIAFSYDPINNLFQVILYFKSYNYPSFYMTRTIDFTFDIEYDSFFIPAFQYVGPQSTLYKHRIGYYYWDGLSIFLERFKSYDTGYESGYLEGESDGYEEGRADGILVGSENGFNSGYDIGFDEGDAEGFQRGYDKGKKDGESLSNAAELTDATKGFLFALFDAPVNTFLNVFDFTWNGFDFLGLIRLILSLLVISGVVKVLV